MRRLKVYELLEELNKRDCVCSYVYSRDKGTLAAWYRPVSHCMQYTRKEAEEQLQFLRWLKDEREEIGDVSSDSVLGRILATLADYRPVVDTYLGKQI